MQMMSAGAINEGKRGGKESKGNGGSGGRKVADHAGRQTSPIAPFDRSVSILFHPTCQYGVFLWCNGILIRAGGIVDT
jgi:hypothetical protein